MVVYHGTTKIIRHPEVFFSKRYSDFGPGFYIISYKDQAWKWALTKGLRQGREALIENEPELFGKG